MCGRERERQRTTTRAMRNKSFGRYEHSKGQTLNDRSSSTSRRRQKEVGRKRAIERQTVAKRERAVRTVHENGEWLPARLNTGSRTTLSKLHLFRRDAYRMQSWENTKRKRQNSIDERFSYFSSLGITSAIPSQLLALLPNSVAPSLTHSLHCSDSLQNKFLEEQKSQRTEEFDGRLK